MANIRKKKEPSTEEKFYNDLTEAIGNGDGFEFKIKVGKEVREFRVVRTNPENGRMMKWDK